MQTIDDLILFAQQNHAGFRGWPIEQLRMFFEKYQATTIIDAEGDKLYGFAVYQQWPDQAHFICIASNRPNAFEWLRGIVRKLKQKATWFDEDKMELVTICLH